MSGLTPSLVIYLMKSGQRQTDIAQSYSVSRQYVNKLAKQGGHISPITTVKENMPWEVDPELRRNSTIASFRLVGHAAVAPDNLSEESRERANSLIRRLKEFNVVVDYDPAYPPIIGLTSLPGAKYLPRPEDDEDFIMKIRPGVRITPLGSRIWRLPKQPL